MSDPKRIVFVCVENSCRSQIAEGFARRIAVRLRDAGGPTIEVFSAGSRPSGVINPGAISTMNEFGIDLSRQSSKGLADLPDVSFDAAVTMGCGDECPALRAVKRFELQIPDPKHMPPEGFRAVRDRIGAEVERIIREM